MDKDTNVKAYLAKTLKFFGSLFIICALVLTAYVVVGNLTKDSIEKELTSVLSELSAASGANSIDVDICAAPDEFNAPWDMEYHIFLTVNISHVGQLGEEKILQILNNGMELGDTAYGYDWELRDYSLYTRSVTDSVLGKTHPVFVTVTDGDKSYTLERDNLFDENILCMEDAYHQLQPPATHQSVSIMILCTVILFGVTALVIGKRIEKRRQLKQEREEELAAQKRNDTTLGLDRILRQIDDDIAQQREDKKRERKKKLWITAVAAVAVIALAGALVIKHVVIPTKQYDQAVALQQAGEDAQAYAMFESLADFKDARDICNQYDYTDAVTYLEEGRYATAFYKLNGISGYEAAETKKAELLEAHPHLGILTAAAGEEILLGSYEQDNNISNGPEEIEWIVLKNENGILFAVSKYILDAKAYNTHNGDGSTLKIWLKNDFYHAAFGDMDDGFISKVGLLTEDDMQVYHSIANAKPEWSTYAMAQDPDNHYYAGYSWWLDGDYFHGYGSADVDMDVVTESGSYFANVSTITSINGVRPAIIIDCVSENADYYAGDREDMANAGVTTRTEEDVRYITGNSGSSGSTKCTRCNGTGKVTQHFGNSWNQKEGYRYGERCGKCGGSGYCD